LTAHVNSNADELVEVLKRKAPEYLDLLTAETDAQFEGAFDLLLEKAVSHLETNKTHYATLDEEGLSAALAGSLAVPGLTVTQETHSNGHVDLTIQADHCRPARKKLGEAKIYGGPAYHFGGLKQLLGRYTTGREGRGLLIEYYRKSDIAGLVTKLREEMDKDRPCNQQGETGDHTLKWSFLSAHSHSSGEAVNVGHVGCNLWIDKAP
jgi:hypothetical protein